jgi:hypothetical protein
MAMHEWIEKAPYIGRADRKTRSKSSVVDVAADYMIRNVRLSGRGPQNVHQGSSSSTRMYLTVGFSGRDVRLYRLKV